MATKKYDRSAMRSTPFLALLCVTIAGNVSIAAETLTGAQLASDPRVTFPTYTPAISGNSLVVGPGDLDFAKFVDIRLGSFTYDDVLEVKINMTVLTADYDPKFVLSDGIRMYGVSIGDDNGGTLNFIRFSDNGNRGGYDGSDAGFQNGGWPAIGQSLDITMRFSFSAASSTAFGAYGHASAQFTTPQQYIDPHRELHLDIVQDNEDVEQYQINSLTLSIPEPKALYFTGSTSNALNVANNYARDLAGSLVSPIVPTGGTDVYFASTNALASKLNATLGTNIAVNSLTFGTGAAATNTVDISGPGTLTIRAGTGANAAGTGIVKQAGSPAVTINSPVALAASQSWTNSSATPITVSGAVGLGTNTLTLAGTGPQVVAGVVHGSGGVTVTDTSTVTLSGANTYTGTTTINSAAGTLRVGVNARTPLLVNAGGTNITAGRVIFEYTTGNNPLSAVQSILTAGYNEPSKFATGQIRSTAATAFKGLGYGDSGSAITIMYTVYGDATLDGVVNYNDFLVLQSNFGVSGTRFDQGNFNYDGATDFNDFLILQSNFGRSISSLMPPLPKEQVAAINQFAASAPEPSSFALLGLFVVACCRR